jgi:DNA-binding transcriptional ArsR family regulator
MSDNESGIDGPADCGYERCELYVELEVGFPDDCTLSEEFPDFTSLDIFVFDGVCRCKGACSDSNDEVVQVTQEVDSDCICRVFAEYDCPPNVEDTDGSQAIISGHLPDRKVLRGLIDDLKTVSERVRLLRIVEIESATGDDEENRSITFDLTSLTETQRETLEVAVTNGYYEDPKEISLEELASKLDITKSALSRRLKRAEANLVSRIIQTE